MFVGSVYALLYGVQSVVVLVCLQDPSTPSYTASSQWSSWCVCRIHLRPVTQRPVSGRLGVFAGSFYALLHSVQSVVVLVCLQGRSTPCYTVSSQWSSWCVCRIRLRPATQCPVSGRLGVFAGSVYALPHSVQSVVVLVWFQASSTPCYTMSSQWSSWCVCMLSLRPATQRPVSGRLGVFAGSVYALLHSVQSVVVLVCLQDPSTPCYTASSQWSYWCVCRIHLRPATQCPVSGRLGLFAGSVYALLHSVQSVVVFLGPLAHNAFFAVTLHFMSGLVFLLSGPILAVPIVLLL